MRKPRPFSHRPIFIDERRELLDEIEQRARRELGSDDPSQLQPQHSYMSFAGRRRQKTAYGTGNWMLLPMMMLLIVVLVVIWKLLL